ncbi:serine/threonine-protein kinase [Cylindrospermum sp. FACHB-282]|uniref:serine/threonine-protein kinase n=1 Tax=Cylindrospermum sp. FACHB-282 TaxID=2692794 RepID=UPI001687F110|nr:serine/threonine-protein kinase [Cylindrospermum sp. FACHB-282]MBD2387693.1 serine/threonine protein kinase [Cylindrospermum sp. FACHB-282]
MIGKILQARYKIVQSLGAGVFGQTYIAADIDCPENSKCVVKQLKVNSCQSSYLDYLRLRFLTETETLKHLGCHHQIPKLITCFEENERFYLIQEYIVGHSLTVELPSNQQWRQLWTESKVVEFLQDVLGILEFVHSQGFIHCDIKPENIIRRASDGKLVLIDFGSIQPIDFSFDSEIPISKIPVTSLGYIPPEQFIGQSKPNSDLYALGMIAIQALTGITPLQLNLNPHGNEIIWRSENTPVNNYLAAVLSRMIRYNFLERFQSATEVIRVLQEMFRGTQLPQITQPQSQVSQPSEVEDNNSHQPSPFSRSSPLLTGIKVGLTVNTLLMGLGTYSLVNNSSVQSETETLYKAAKEYQAGDLQEAIALAKSIPSHSNVYPEAQATIEAWHQQWQIATEHYLVTEEAFNQGRWSDVLQTASKVPKIAYWQFKISKLLEQAQANIETQTQDLLGKAYERAENRDFSAALGYLRQIPQESTAGAIVQRKLAEYSQKRQIRANYFFHKAHKKASAGEFSSAIQFLSMIPKDTSVYAQAQIKLNEYTQQRLLAEAESIARFKMIPTPPKSNSFVPSNSDSMNDNFPMENSLQEVNIR